MTQKDGKRSQQVYTLLVQLGRKEGDGLPSGATGAALMCYASGVDEAEAAFAGAGGTGAGAGARGCRRPGHLSKHLEHRGNNRQEEVGGLGLSSAGLVGRGLGEN